MAARRLKFKPKPLVGLIRRNKDQNNEQESASNNDVLLSESNTLVNKNEHDEKSLVDGGLDQSKEVSSKQNDLEFLSSQNSVNSNSKIIDSDNLKNVTQTDSFLKSVINNKIKSVLSNNFSDSLRTNPGVSSESTVCSDNCTETNKFTEINKITNVSDAILCSTKNVNDLEHPESNSENALPISNNNISDANKSLTTDTIPHDQELQRNNNVNSEQISSATDLTVSDNNELQNTGSSQNKINTSQGSESDKKDSKSTNQCQRLPRFGKRIKPVLSNIVRKKDLENKPEDTTVPEILVPPTTPKTISKDDDLLVSVSESVVNIEKSVEKENVDKNIAEHTVLYLDKEPVSLMKQASSEDTELLDSLNKSDPLTDNENEVDQSVRSPVKIFSPKKRQRSQATSSSSTIVKAFQSFKDKFKDGNMDKKKLIMRDLIFYNPTTNPMREITPGVPKKEIAKHENETKSLLDEKLEEEKIDDIDNEETESMPVPQVKVGPDGKIIIDPKSLVIEATGIQKNRANLENSEVVQENEYSYSKFNKRKVRRIEWSAEETLLFYKSLNDLGADFSLMQSLFPKKTRKDLKVKFKKEEKLNSHLIDKAMRSCSKFDFAALEKELQKDREERVRKLEEMKRLKEEKKKERLEKKPQPRKKIIKRKSDALREFDEGDSGIIRVGKKYEDKVHKILEFKRKQINNEDSNSAAKLKKNNLSSKRHSKKNTVEKENNSEVPGLYPKTSFDFRLFASDDEDETTSEIYDKQNSDNDSIDDNIFQRILTTTRSGRQPKSALNKRKVPPVKVAEHNNNKKRNKKNKNSGHGESNVEIIYENGKQFSVISNVVSPENLDQYYTLFAEPLDLSHGHGVEDDSNQTNDNSSIIKDNQDNNIYNNVGTMVPIMDSGISTEILNSAFSSESLNNENSINNRTSERNLTESLQIMEELTVGNDNTNDSNFNNNEQMNENGDYSFYILPEIETNVNKDDNNTNDNCVVQSESTDFNEYSTSENLTDDNNYRDVQNHLPPIIINASQISSGTYLSAQPQIQIVPKEQISYILGQNSNVIFQSGISDHNNLDDSNTENNEDDSLISHSSIHCYPSSDHTYTSLKPLPPVKKNTFVILSSLNSENVTCEQPRPTIVLYPT